MSQHGMNLRKDLYDINDRALFVYLVGTSIRNTNYLNYLIYDLSLKDYNNTDYLDAIQSITQAKNKAIADINNAAYIAFSQTTEIAQDAKKIAEDAKLIAQDAKLIAQDAKQLVDILSNNQSAQYTILLGKIDEVYNLSMETKEVTVDTKLILDTLTINQNDKYADLLYRIDYLFNEFYRSTSSNIIETYDMRV